MLRTLSGLNTVGPDHDIGGMTAFLAGTVVFECIMLVALAKRLSKS